MFKQLFRLCRRDDTPLGKTPLEDFTTEVFVGILQMNASVKSSIIEWLELPKDEYHISSQESYSTDHCRIDIVIEGENNLCFIECKVESKENEGQLEKYSKLLDRLYKEHGKETHLRYLTKKQEPKDIAEHNFLQKRWYEVYELLSTHDDPVVNDFLNFLKSQKMSKKTTLMIEDFQAMSSMMETMETIEHYLDASKGRFESLFGTIKEKKFDSHNRMVNIIEKIVGDATDSDFKYGFYFDNPQMYVGLYMPEKYKNYKDVKALSELVKNKGFDFDLRKDDDGTIHGLVISKSKDMSYLLNDENAPNEIEDWFTIAFEEFDSFFKETKSTVNWKFN